MLIYWSGHYSKTPWTQHEGSVKPIRAQDWSECFMNVTNFVINIIVIFYCGVLFQSQRKKDCFVCKERGCLCSTFKCFEKTKKKKSHHQHERLPKCLAFRPVIFKIAIVFWCSFIKFVTLFDKRTLWTAKVFANLYFIN